MGRPQTITDVDIARAARKVFLKLGPNTSTDAVAQELGVSAAAIFKRVGSKHMLLQMAFAPARPPAFLATLATGPSEGVSMREQLLSLAEQMTAFLRDVIPTILVMQTAGISPRAMGPSSSQTPRARTIQSTSAWLRRAQDARRLGPGCTDAMAALFVGSIEAPCFVEHLDQRRRKRAALSSELESIIDVLWRGFAPTRHHDP